MLKAEQITVCYGARTVVSEVSFSLSQGQWLMLVGPNGAGKSSLIKAVSRSVPHAGRVLLFGRDVRDMKPAELARGIGVLAQKNDVSYAYTVEEVVSLGRYAHARGFLHAHDDDGGARVEHALERTGLTALRSKSMLTLSGGELQRAFLAQVLAQNPRILLLDEPSNHLDLPYQKHIFSLIDAWRQEPGRAVISVVHDLSLARQYGTHAVLMKDGCAIAQGTMEQTLTADNLLMAYGMDVKSWMRELAKTWET